jgi:hypothetical protein
MTMKLFKKSLLHILAWGIMFIYFLVAPDLFTLIFLQNGKPLQTDQVLPSESDQIKFVIDGMDPYMEGGEKLYKMYGWALMAPEAGMSMDGFTREITLISEERTYFFSTETEYRNPDLETRLIDAGVDLDRLGFSLLIAEDVIKPGKYRIGIIFRNDSTGSAFYWDKPVHYLVKTPNTLRLEQK